jgi:hypothetical protein
LKLTKVQKHEAQRHQFIRCGGSQSGAAWRAGAGDCRFVAVVCAAAGGISATESGKAKITDLRMRLTTPPPVSHRNIRL